MADTSVLVVGGGFAGVACAKALAKQKVKVLLLDENNYHQFQPLLYQVATAQIAAYDIARPLRGIFRHDETVEVDRAAVVSIDPDKRSVTTAHGRTVTADVLVVAAGAQPNFFGTPGAPEHSFPMYSLDDAERLRSHILTVLEAAVEHPDLVEKGALTFVIVGGGATGVESAGAIAELLRDVLPERLQHLSSASAVHVVDLGKALLAPFSDRAHAYAAKRMEHDGVTVHLGVGVKQVQADRVVLSDGTQINTRTIIWAGGEKAADVVGSTGMPAGRGGRVDVERDLTVPGYPRVYVLGDAANIQDSAGQVLPQLGLGRAAVRGLGRAQYRRRPGWEAASAVPLQGQGHHGDDRPQRRGRRDGAAPARGRGAGGLRGVARGARHAPERGAKPDRRVRCLGLGLLQQEPSHRAHRPTRCRDHRLGRRGRGAA